MVGDSIQLYSGKNAVIFNTEKLEGSFKVYNFEVAEFHSYFVAEKRVLVHNANCVREDFEPKGGAQTKAGPDGWSNSDVADLLGWAKTKNKNFTDAANFTKNFAEGFNSESIQVLKSHGFTRQNLKVWQAIYQKTLNLYINKFPGKDISVPSSRLESVNKLLDLWE